MALSQATLERLQKTSTTSVGGLSQATTDRLKTRTNKTSFSRLTPETIARLSGKSVKKQEQIFSGGTFSDIIDVISTPQYALTGLLDPKSSVLEAIKTRRTPGDALGVKNPWAKFAVDVIADPLWFLGGPGALGKAAKTFKAGEQATTLAARVAKGQSAMVRAVVPFTDISVPLIKGERAARGLTKASQFIKGTKIPFTKGTNIGQVLKGTFGTLPAATGKISDIGMEGIESQLTTFKQARTLEKGLRRAENIAKRAGVTDIRNPYTEVQKLLKKGIVKQDDVVKMSENLRLVAAGEKPLYKIVKPLTKVYKATLDYVPEVMGAVEKAGLLGTKELRGLTNIASKEAREARTQVGVAGKVLNKKQALEQQANIVKLGDNIVQMFGKNKARTVTRADVNAKVFKTAKGEPEDMFYKTLDANKIEALHKKIVRISPATKNIDRLLKREELTATLDFLKGKGLKRTRVSPEEANRAFIAAGKKAPLSTDVFEQLIATKVGAEVSMARKATIKHIRSNPNLAVQMSAKDLPEGYKMYTVGELKGLAGPRDVVETLEQTMGTYSKFDTLDRVAKVYDGLQNWWKKTATYINLAFHTRNAVSNTWMQAMAGMTNPADYIEGYRLTRKVAALRKTGKGLKSLPKEELQLYKEFVEEGLGGVGQYFGDIERSLRRQNFVFEAGGALGGWLEDSAKLGMYRYFKKKGWSQQAAAEQVRKYLFDYTDLTDIERAVFKRILPFYTWSRKNIPAQLSILIQNPAKIGLVGKFKNAVEENAKGKPIDPSLLPEWLKSGYPMYIGQDGEGFSQYFNLQGFLPTVDLGKLSNLPSEILGQVSPLPKTLVEVIANYDFFTKQPVVQYTGQQSTVFGEEIPVLSDPRMRKVLDLFRPLREAEQVTGTDKTAIKKGVQPLSQRLLRTLGGASIQEFKEVEQKKLLKTITDKEISRVKLEIKKARMRKQSDVVTRLQDILKQIRTKEIELKL